MTELLQHFAEIIDTARQGPLGIFALVVLALLVLAVIFFRKAPNNTQLAVFGTLTLAFLTLAGLSLWQAGQKIIPGDEFHIVPEAETVDTRGRDRQVSIVIRGGKPPYRSI